MTQPVVCDGCGNKEPIGASKGDGAFTRVGFHDPRDYCEKCHEKYNDFRDERAGIDFKTSVLYRAAHAKLRKVFLEAHAGFQLPDGEAM